MYEASFDNQRVIDPKHKLDFEGEISVHYSYDVSKAYPAIIRISGDWDDHINTEHLISSLDVSLKKRQYFRNNTFQAFFTRNKEW